MQTSILECILSKGSKVLRKSTGPHLQALDHPILHVYRGILLRQQFTYKPSADFDEEVMIMRFGSLRNLRALIGRTPAPWQGLSFSKEGGNHIISECLIRVLDALLIACSWILACTRCA